jgi:hypothetical protein
VILRGSGANPGAGRVGPGDGGNALELVSGDRVRAAEQARRALELANVVWNTSAESAGLSRYARVTDQTSAPYRCTSASQAAPSPFAAALTMSLISASSTAAAFFAGICGSKTLFGLTSDDPDAQGHFRHLLMEQPPHRLIHGRVPGGGAAPAALWASRQAAAAEPHSGAARDVSGIRPGARLITGMGQTPARSSRFAGKGASDDH